MLPTSPAGGVLLTEYDMGELLLVLPLPLSYLNTYHLLEAPPTDFLLQFPPSCSAVREGILLARCNLPRLKEGNYLDSSIVDCLDCPSY